jgi:hypothetical protein
VPTNPQANDSVLLNRPRCYALTERGYALLDAWRRPDALASLFGPWPRLDQVDQPEQPTPPPNGHQPPCG